MRIKHYSEGRFYVIDCPPGSRVVREASSYDLLIVPFGEKDVPISSEPEELLPLLADAGRCGLSLVGESEAVLAS
ncbi:hypothetical protein EP7_002030 [Isosphaeraceae bacterium EP7]